jgi:hypothetical protein
MAERGQSLLVTRQSLPAGTGLPLRHRGEVAAELVALHADVRAGRISPRDGRDVAILLRQVAKSVPRTALDADALDGSDRIARLLDARG